QPDLALLARQALLGQPRRLPHRRGEVLVAAPAETPAGHRHLLPGAHEVVAAAVPARHLRAGRHAHHERLALRAVAQRALPIGAATARHAAKAGYRLVLGARSEDKLQALRDELGALTLRTDVTSWDDQQALVQHALDAYGRLDVAFANAGVGHPRGFEAGDPE